MAAAPEVHARMRKARAARKEACRKRREDARDAERAQRTQQRHARQAAAKTERARKPAAPSAPSRSTEPQAPLFGAARPPVGRPPKLKPRPARWTDFDKSYPRRVYRAILRGDIKYPSSEEIAPLFSVTARTIRNWVDRHPAFARATDRALDDRARVRSALSSCRRVEIDPARLPPPAATGKIDRATIAPEGRARMKRLTTVVRVSFDAEYHEMLLKGGYLKTHMRRRWLCTSPPPPEHQLARLSPQRRENHLRYLATSPHVDAAVSAVMSGHLSNRAIAEQLAVAESTLRLWRKQCPELDAAIEEAVAACQEWQSVRD